MSLIAHFAIDFTRALVGLRIPSLTKPAQRSFWFLLGLDQLAHGLVLVAIAAVSTQRS